MGIAREFATEGGYTNTMLVNENLRMRKKTMIGLLECKEILVCFFKL